jgi:hypothetical protein
MMFAAGVLETLRKNNERKGLQQGALHPPTLNPGMNNSDSHIEHNTG